MDEELVNESIVYRGTLTITPRNGVMSFNKKRLEEFGFEGGEYNVLYNKDEIKIVKKIFKIESSS